MIHTRKRALIAAVAIGALTTGGVAFAAATGGDDDATDTPIGGAALDRAKAAAVSHTGGGRVTGTEVGDEEGYYEVEVTRADGRQVDVHLDRRFRVLDAKADGEAQGAGERNDD